MKVQIRILEPIIAVGMRYETWFILDLVLW